MAGGRVFNCGVWVLFVSVMGVACACVFCCVFEVIVVAVVVNVLSVSGKLLGSKL